MANCNYKVNIKDIQSKYSFKIFCSSDNAEIQAEIGNLEDLTTTAKNNLVSAINEVHSNTETNATAISGLQSGKEDKSNKVTSISSASTDTQYPSAKAVYDSQVTQDETISTLETNLEETQEELDYYKTIYNVLPKATGNGENITLDNTGESILKLDPRGQCKQDSTTGKNKFELKTTAAATVTTNDNKNFTYIPLYNGANDYLINGEENTAYTISVNLSSTVGADIYIYILYTDNTSEAAGYMSGSGVQSGTITKTSNASKTLKGISVRAYNKDTYNNYLFSEPMVRLSTETDTYEPYTGGQPSPSPDFPQQIHEVSGDNGVVVCGKNLLNISTLDNAGGSSLTTEIVGNTIKLTQSGTSSWQFRKFITDLDINDYKGKTLVISGISSNNTNIRIALYNSSKNLVGDLYTTLVIPNDTTASYIGIQLYQSNGTGINGTTTFNDLQVELGSTATSYEPYNGDTYELDLGVLGKNLFDSKVEQGAINSNAGQTYAQCKTSNATRIRTIDLIKLDTSKTYTISIKNGYSYVVQPFNNEGKLYDTGVGGYGQWKTTSFNITNVPYIALAFRNSSETNITPSEIDSLEVMLEVGTSASPYEKYNPFKMRGIGNYEDYFTKNTGKNLFDNTNYLKGYYYSSNGLTQLANWGIFYVKCNANETFTISGLKNYPSAYMAQVDNNKDFVSTIVVRTSADKYTITSTMEGYIGVSFVWGESANGSELDTMQIEKGNQATIYEPYGTGKWCKYNSIGNIVLDGNSIMSGFSSHGGTTYMTANYQNKNAKKVGENETGIKCDKLMGTNINNTWTGAKLYSCSLSANGNYIQICLPYADAPTLQELSTWLGNNNLSMVYWLSSPYLSLIENETLISQLDKVEKALAKQGKTNISQSNNDAPFKIYASALKEIE